VLRGVTTVRLQTDDLEAAKRWYTELLGVAPYFERPGYVEFRIGDFEQELGLLDRGATGRLGNLDVSVTQPSGVVAYWYVDDVATAVDRLLGMGATTLEAPWETGGGFTVASVVDPFGNVLGVMHSPHYLEVVSGSKG
jgi:predicted enzyme related to lactoylglutathione lyase